MKNIGGQAVIEGVMMKSPAGWTVAVRDQKGEIHVKKQVLEKLPDFLTLPFVVAGSDLVATVPDLVARALGRPLRLRILPCPVPIPRLPVSLVWHMRTQEDAAHAWFRNLIVNVSQKLVRNVAPRAAVAVRRRKP